MQDLEKSETGFLNKHDVNLEKCRCCVVNAEKRTSFNDGSLILLDSIFKRAKLKFQVKQALFVFLKDFQKFVPAHYHYHSVLERNGLSF
jgi:hypothetical protein